MKALTAILLVIFSLLNFHTFGQTLKNNTDLKILCVIPNNLGANFNFNIDNMESYGWDVTWAGLTETVNTCSWSSPQGHISVDSDTLLQDIDDVTNWDVIALMPAKWWSGNAYGDLLNSQETLDLLVQAKESELIIWATCAGVRVLAAADIIDDVNVTGRSEYASEYIAAGANYMGTFIPPVIDENFITSSKGMFFHYQNIEAIITALAGLQGKNGSQQLSVNIKENNQSFFNENIIWSKTFGGENSEGAASVIQTSDGGFVMCGYSNIPNNNSNLLIIKTDNEGNEQWNYAFGGEGWEAGKSICETSTGDFVATGYSTSEGAGLQDVLAIKVSSGGELIWNKTFGGPGLDIGFSICETSDEKLLICGYTESFGAGMDDIYVLKLNENGDEIWNETYGGSESDLGRKIIELSDGNYAIIGTLGYSQGNGIRDVLLVKTDANGNIIWTQTYGVTNDYQDAFSVKETSDGGFIIAAQSHIQAVDLLDAYIIKTDSDGNLTWDYMYEGTDSFYDYAKDVVETANGNFLICGHTKNNENRINQAFIFLVDQDGNEIWAEEYGDIGSDWTNSICSTSDGNFVLAGHTSSYGSGKHDAWLFKLQNHLTFVENNPNPQRTHLFQNIPNPVKSTTAIKLTIHENRGGTLAIYNSNGVVVKSFGNLGKGSHSIVWNRADNNNSKVLSGLYYLSLEAGAEVFVRKIIVL